MTPADPETIKTMPLEQPARQIAQAPRPSINQAIQVAHKESETIKQILNHGVRLVGFPLTLAGLFRVAEELEKRPRIADNLLAAVAIIFFVSWIMAFLSVRSDQAFRHRLENISSVLFHLGLVALIGLIGMMILGA
jgi:hypothetical protein